MKRLVHCALSERRPKQWISGCICVKHYFLFTPGHKKARLFITHGGQNSLLQAVYHAVPVLGIPLFGDQFDNVVRAETKGLGLSISPTHITRELLSSAVQTLIRDTRYVDGWVNLICDATCHACVDTPFVFLYLPQSFPLQVQVYSFVPKQDPQIPSRPSGPSTHPVGGSHPAQWRWCSSAAELTVTAVVPETPVGCDPSSLPGAHWTCCSLLDFL